MLAVRLTETIKDENLRDLIYFRRYNIMTSAELKRLKLTDTLIAVYSRVDQPTKFDVGYVIDFSEEWLLLLAVDEYGKYDGYCIRCLENIFRIEMHSQYLSSIPIRDDVKQEIIVGGVCIKTIYDILLKLKESHVLFSAELFNDSENHTCGYINDVYNDLLIVDEVDSYGHKDGNAVFEPDNITSIWFDSQELKKLETLI